MKRGKSILDSFISQYDAFLQQSGNVCEIDLANVNATDADVVEIVNYLLDHKVAYGLRLLLQGNPIGKDGAEALMKLMREGGSCLRELYIDGDGLDRETIQALVDTMQRNTSVHMFVLASLGDTIADKFAAENRKLLALSRRNALISEHPYDERLILKLAGKHGLYPDAVNLAGESGWLNQLTSCCGLWGNSAKSRYENSLQFIADEAAGIRSRRGPFE